MRIEHAIPICLLYNEELLRYLLDYRLNGALPSGQEEASPQEEPFKKFARREFQLYTERRDNEVFNSLWESFRHHHEAREPGQLALAALKELCETYLEFRHGGLHARLEHYAEWQNLVSNANAQPIIAYAMQLDELHGRPNPLPPSLEPSHDAEGFTWYNPLCYPYDSAVEDYITRGGLNDAHLHINACAYAELCWLHALNSPEAYADCIEDKNVRAVHQQVLEIFGHHHVATIHEHLLLARNIRAILYGHAEGGHRCDKARYEGPALRYLLKGQGAESRIRDLVNTELPSAPGRELWEQGDFRSIIRDERRMMARIIRSLIRAGHEDATRWLGILFHVYLLLMNEFCNLLTMKETQKGFNQFDHTYTVPHQLGDHPQYYYETFRHLHGWSPHEASIVHHLDARIAPKDSKEKNEAQLFKILKSYLRYLRWLAGEQAAEEPENLRNTLDDIEELRPRLPRRYLLLSLTAHFIKKQAKGAEDDYRQQAYRNALVRELAALHELLSAYPGAGRFLCGVDAANDEQNIPPSVLAPCFRACRYELNMEHITFHCGEDFPHLLTGMRVLDDASRLLEMGRGDRIGHGTALGIAPDQWQESSPRCISMRREDRLLDLAMAYSVLKQDAGVAPAVLHSIHDEMMQHAYELFSNSIQTFNDYDLMTALQLRHLSPACLRAWLGSEPALIVPRIEAFKRNPEAYRPIHADLFDRSHPEYKLMERHLRSAPTLSLQMLHIWFTSAELRQRGQEFVQVKEKKEYAPLYLSIQQHLMRRFCEKGIIIETLPTSNLRIACYRNAGEHHIMRWLHCPSSTLEGDAKLQVAFGSDDPGIFSCDAKAEFYLLYACLREHGIPEQQALSMLHDVNRRGRVFSFANTNRPHATADDKNLRILQ